MGKRSNKNRHVDINAEDAKKYGWAVETAHRLAELGFLQYPSVQRSKQKYDGVLGEPPEWFPHTSKGDFLICRDRVLDHHTRPSPETARRWISAWEEDQMDVVNQVPLDLHHEIHRLSRLFRAYRLGPDKGLNLLLGKGQAKALAEGKTRDAGRDKAGKITGERKQRQGQQTETLIRTAEAELRSEGVRKVTNKVIAGRLKVIAKRLKLPPHSVELSVDHIRKVRKKRL